MITRLTTLLTRFNREQPGLTARIARFAPSTGGPSELPLMIPSSAPVPRPWRPSVRRVTLAVCRSTATCHISARQASRRSSLAQGSHGTCILSTSRSHCLSSIVECMATLPWSASSCRKVSHA